MITDFGMCLRLKGCRNEQNVLTEHIKCKNESWCTTKHYDNWKERKRRIKKRPNQPLISIERQAPPMIHKRNDKFECAKHTHQNKHFSLSIKWQHIEPHFVWSFSFSFDFCLNDIVNVSFLFNFQKRRHSIDINRMNTSNWSLFCLFFSTFRCFHSLRSLLMNFNRFAVPPHWRLKNNRIEWRPSRTNHVMALISKVNILLDW